MTCLKCIKQASWTERLLLVPAYLLAGLIFFLILFKPLSDFIATQKYDPILLVVLSAAVLIFVADITVELIYLGLVKFAKSKGWVK